MSSCKAGAVQLCAAGVNGSCKWPGPERAHVSPANEGTTAAAFMLHSWSDGARGSSGMSDLPQAAITQHRRGWGVQHLGQVHTHVQPESASPGQPQKYKIIAVLRMLLQTFEL